LNKAVNYFIIIILYYFINPGYLEIYLVEEVKFLAASNSTGTGWGRGLSAGSGWATGEFYRRSRGSGSGSLPCHSGGRAFCGCY